MHDKRLFIVSNRLPVNIEAYNTELLVKQSSGGLVTAINSFLKSPGSCANQFSKTYWVGVPGCSPGSWSKAEKLLTPGNFDYLPVFINKTTYEKYYNGFSNSALWPLFHYFPSYAEFDIEDYNNYLKANTFFLETIVRNARPNDVIWIHDYHLLPLAEMIRKEISGITIGFFLHIPFPSFEIIRLLPKDWQEKILKGMLGADLIGFHTIDYATHFLECVKMIFGLDHEMNIIRYDDRLIKADVFPISIDYDCFNSAFDKISVSAAREALKKRFPGKKIIFSVDRLDYTKGVSNRLKAYEYFLQNNPDYKERVVFIMVVVPSRDAIQKYAERKRMIDEMISNINSKIGNVHWQPVIYQYTDLDFDAMITLCTSCDVALITPMRDGMNLVAKEFVASRKDLQGVLILSEMAGAARELTDALIINPNDTKEMAEMIRVAFAMNNHEQKKRLSVMQTRIKQYNVTVWAEDFLEQLEATKKKQKEFQIKFLDELTRVLIFDEYGKSEQRLFLLDYDGTLISYSSLPMEAKPHAELLELLKTVSSSPQNDVYIISGRDSETLEGWFGALPVNIIAEHGASIKKDKLGWKNSIADPQDWKLPVGKILESYVKRCANSLIEEKQFSMVWHYRNAPVDQGKLRALELVAELNQFTHHLGLQVMMGNKIVEIRNKGVDKGKALKNILSQNSYDFILAAGDDVTDEDLFKVLMNNEKAFTFKIGSDASYAKYNLHTPQMVISMLQAMSHIREIA